MSLESRLNQVEQALGAGDSRLVFHHCTEHDGLPWEEHVELHRQRGEYLFTLDLGAASVREDVA